MGKVIYGMAQSLDGYVAAADGQIGVPPPEEALHRHFNAKMARTAVALYGRRIYEIMRYWETADTLPESQPWDVEFARLWQDTPKVVVSSTLLEVGPNATLLADDVDRGLQELVARTDGEIDVAGPTLAATLTRLGLIDEYHLYLHPVVLGGGLPFFAGGQPLQLRILGVDELSQGVRCLRYGR
ncbi:MAG: dihydrofolate reductase family protein [Myxococcota bacterium]